MKGVSITLLLGKLPLFKSTNDICNFYCLFKNDIWTLNIADVSYDATENA